MPTRNVVLTERQDDLIDALVQSGRYQNASEVMREGLRLVENNEVAQAVKLDALRAAVQIGIDEIDRGEFREFADGKELLAHLKEIGVKAISAKMKL